MSTETQKEETFIIKYKKEILGGLIALLSIVFVLMNSQNTVFWFFGLKTEQPLVIFLVVFYALGFLTHFIISYFNKKELKNKVKELEKSSGNKLAEKNIAALEEKINKLEKDLKDKNNTPPPTTPPPAV